MHVILEALELDFEDSMGTLPEDEQQFIIDNALGVWWVDTKNMEEAEELLVEKITETLGWCVKSFKFCENRPHRLTAFK